jgi:hypothetical protein
MTPAQKKAQALYDGLDSERLRLGGKLPKERWLFLVAEFIVAWKVAKKNATPLNKMTEAEFMAWLQENEVYKGIDIKREIGKCQNWCTTNNKQAPSRARIVNWLNKAEKPFGSSMAGKSDAPAIGSIYDPPPDGWREVARRLHGPQVADRDWKDIRVLFGREILAEAAKGRS